ncbi:MAG: PilZ domain-containing protein [Desulfobacterales bacterium]|nr:PilZ domain-containing protein [Desulfobacterales bacterium]
MKDRRQFKRFKIALPAKMETVDSNRKQIFKFKTRDISAAGAFIDTTEIFSEGTRLKMDFTVSSSRIKELTGAMSLIECEGSVVRSIDYGIAVRFNGDCQVFGLKGM